MTPREVAAHPAMLAKIPPVDWERLERYRSWEDADWMARDEVRQGLRIASWPVQRREEAVYVRRAVSYRDLHKPGAPDRLYHIVLVGEWWYWAGPVDCFRAPLKKD